MEVIDFFVGDNKDHWLAEIQKSDWGAGKYLYELLREQKLKELCVYVFGTDQPIKTFSGKVVGVYHRLNDNEDKWIVSLNEEKLCADDILEAISFQEQYFMGELYTL